MNKKLLAVVAVIVVILLLSLVGAKISGKLFGKLLKKGVENVIENKTGGDVKVNFGSDSGVGGFEIEENGQKTNVAIGVDIPANFPKDIEIYKSAKVKASSSASGDEGNAISLILTSADNTKKIYDFYLTSLEKSGWRVTSKVESSDEYQIYATRDVDRSAIITVGESSDGSSINITVVLEAK